MAQHLRKFFSVFFIVILALIVWTVPSFHHDCSLRGEHNFYSGFFVEESESHCICCEDIDTHSDKCCEHEEEYSEICKNSTAANAEGASITHTQCCQIRAVMLQITTTLQKTHDFKLYAPVIITFLDVNLKSRLCDYYTDIFIKSPHSPPEIYKGLQPIIFLFSQFLL